MSLVYLDHNATAPLRPGVLKAMTVALEAGGNPSSIHAQGRAARGRVEDARGLIADICGVKPQEVIFTGSGTEANNLAIGGIVRAGRAERVIVSASEHEAVLAPARASGVALDIVPVTSGGLIDLGALEVCLDAAARAGERVLVSVMLANNETGVCQPLPEIAARVAKVGGLLHTDAVQGLGKLEWTRESLGADMISLSAHKIGGPQGVGALICREGTPIRSMITGGGQELGRRSGTENVPAIAGFGAAIQALGERDAERGRVTALRDRLEAGLKASGAPVTIFGDTAPRLGNTSCFAVPGLKAETVLMALDLQGIAISSGSACSSGKVRTSHVLEAMDVAPELADCALRVSLGWTTLETDIERFLAVWTEHWKRIEARGHAA